MKVVKCGVVGCCSKPRSPLFQILKQFIPPPLRVSQSEGLRILEPSDEGNTYTSLLFRLSINDKQLRQGDGLELSFDYSCPSLRDIIRQRTCQRCFIYHASVKSLKAHEKYCKTLHLHPTSSQRSTITRQIRPVRVAARRQKEKMVVWKSRLNDEHVDWFDEDEVETADDKIDQRETSCTFNIVDIKEHMQNEWEEC